MTQVSFNFKASDFLEGASEKYDEILDRHTLELHETVVDDSPVAFGGIRNGWERTSSGNGFDVEYVIENKEDYSFFGIVGRGPGKKPPIAPLKRWSRLKGMSPYAVQKSIADKGTQRWRDNLNAIGWDRTTSMFRGSSPVRIAQKKILQDVENGLI